MEFVFGILLLSAATFILPEVHAVCKDIDNAACQEFKKADSGMCNKPCLAKFCQKTCGQCPLQCYHCDNVENITDCTTTVGCNSVSEVCIATQRFTTHLDTVFSSGCVNPAICKTLFGVNPKRSYTLHGGCCATDLCNDHDPDNITIYDAGDEDEITRRLSLQNVEESVDDAEDDDTDTCAPFDVSTSACTKLIASTKDICKIDCIGRQICPEACSTCVRCKTCKSVNDPKMCSNITLCKSTQSCFTREQLRDDFSLGINLQCMDDFICHAYFGGIHDVPNADVSKRQFGSNINLRAQCCKTNMCNKDGIGGSSTAASGR